MKKFLMIIAFFTIVLFLAVGVYFSSLGGNFLKNYIVSKICFYKKFTPSYFNYSFNSYSLVLRNENNYVQIFGTFFPYKGDYNANISNLNLLFPFLNGKAVSTGEFKEKEIKGKIYVAGGHAYMHLKCLKGKINGEITGKNFDTSKFLKIFNNLDTNKFGLNFEGVNTIYVKFKNFIFLKADFKGFVKILDTEVFAKIKSFLNIGKNIFSFVADVNGKNIQGKIYVSKNKDSIKYLAKLKKINLCIFRKLIFLPINKQVNLNIFYEPINDIYNFESKFFSGYYKEGELNIQFNLPSKKFFSFFSLPNIINGEVIGNINISKDRGNFSLLIQNAAFDKSVFDMLKKYINIRNSSLKGKVFISGKFNREKIIFDLISKDLNYFWSIKRGVYFFNGKYFFKLYLKTRWKIYLFEISNNNVKLIKEIDNKQNIKTLVY